MRLFILTTLALLSALTFAPAGLAQDKPVADLPKDAIKFSRPKAKLYNKLFAFDKDDRSGGGTDIKSDKFNFLHLRVVINYQLPEGAENISVDSDDIHLVQDGGKKHPSVGSFDDDKVFDDWAKGFWLHSSQRRRNEMLDIVFAIPADATGPYALVIDDLKTLRVEVPKQVTDPPHPADMVDVEIKTIAWGDSVPAEPIEVGDQEIKTTFSVPGRRILAVSLLVHALDYNDSDGKRLNWNGNALALRDSAGNLHPCHGGFFRNYISQNIGHSSEVGKKSTDAETFFFSPPDDIESFELLWYGRPVLKQQMTQ